MPPRGRGELSCDELGELELKQVNAECAEPKETSERALTSAPPATLPLLAFFGSWTCDRSYAWTLPERPALIAPGFIAGMRRRAVGVHRR